MKAPSLSARAPAKLIISGEHSVLYGMPALAVAIDRYTTTTTSWHDSALINFNLLDLAHVKSYTLQALRDLKIGLHKDYQLFLQGKHNIGAVLKMPFDLLQYSVSCLLDSINMQSNRGVSIEVDSNIPIGCGMGSSAAAVISSLYALTNLFKLNWQLQDYLRFAKSIEDLQHGKSSGLDLHLVAAGGCVLFQNGSVLAHKSISKEIFFVNTGKPQSTTGECVSLAASKVNNDVINQFGAVTMEIDAALSANDHAGFNAAIMQNHRLLQSIGVVPTKVADFIADVERCGSAAKVCGAGAIKGENAGVVLLTDVDNITHVANNYGYIIERARVDVNGTQII